MSGRIRLWLLIGALGLLAAVGHWLFWYQPRLRPAAPGDDLPGRLLASGDFDTAIWLAYPHQNLPSLATATGLDAGSLAASLRLAGLDLPALDRMRLPPASSVAVAVRDDRWMVAARVFPAAAGFVRLSGLLAGNPWFAGGRVGEVTVAWRGTTWIASTGPPPTMDATLDSPLDSPIETGDRTPALARVHSRGQGDVLPNGSLRLLAGRDFVVLTSGTAGSPLLEGGRRVLDAAEGLLLVVAAEAEGTPDAPTDQAMLLLPLAAGTDESELPRAAILHRPAGPGPDDCRRWDLPGESLLKIAGHDRPQGAAAGWHADTTDALALGSALAAAPELRALSEAATGLPRWALWLDVVPAAHELDRLARGVEGSPLVSRRERRRWLDAARVLRALARRPARIEGYADGDEMVVRWTATSRSK